MIPDFKKDGWKQVSRMEANIYSMEHMGEEGFDLWIVEPQKDDIDFHDTTTLNPVRNTYWIKPK
jgi:hypothetical protein